MRPERPGDAKLTGAGVKLWIDVVDGDKKAGRMYAPGDNYRAEDIKLHDQSGKPIPLGGKVRFTGTLRKTDICEMSVVEVAALNK